MLDRYLDYKSNHPKSAKHAVVRALTDRAKNVCSSPELLAKELDHLGMVLWYSNYPRWMMDQQGRNNSPGQLIIDLETGKEVKSYLYSTSLFSRFKWSLQETLQIHTHTGLFQWLKHHQINAHVLQTKCPVHSKRMSTNGSVHVLIANLYMWGRPQGHSLDM